MDPHERFAEWLAAGAEGDPPRDAALHASMCDDCMRSASAFDSLQAIDPGAAPLPPLGALASGGMTAFGAARIGVGAFAVILLAASVTIGATGLLRQTQSAAEASSTPGGDVLGGAPSPRSTQRLPSPTPTASTASTSPATSPVSQATAAVPNATVAPTQAPAPVTLEPPPPTAEPTEPPPSASEPPPPTPSPTPTPSPSPTPTPDPSPAPQCSNGLDDDGDLLADFPLDLGCTGPEDDDETGP